MKNRTALFSGLSLFLSFCLLTGSGKASALLGGKKLLFIMLAAELLAFVLPTLLLKLTAARDDRIELRTFLKISAPSVFSFTLFSGLSMAIFTFLMNYAFFRTDAAVPEVWSQLAVQSMESTSGKILILLTFVLIPPICEEIFLRGALFSAHEKLAGTGTCILLSGFCFAMLHGSMNNFIGPMFAGFLYAYLTYAFDCVWPAVAAHIINNLFFIGVLWLTSTYSAFGIWKYFPAICLILLLAFLYLALHALETLLATDRVRRFQTHPKADKNAAFAILNPGFFVFLLAFVAKAMLKLY